MQKRIVVVLVLVALFLAPGGAMGIVATESRVASAKPVLAALEFSDIANLAGPVCFPGDPCGSQTLSVSENLAGPVCFPGDRCGTGGRSERDRLPSGPPLAASERAGLSAKRPV